MELSVKTFFVLNYELFHLCGVILSFSFSKRLSCSAEEGLSLARQRLCVLLWQAPRRLWEAALLCGCHRRKWLRRSQAGARGERSKPLQRCTSRSWLRSHRWRACCISAGVSLQFLNPLSPSFLLYSNLPLSEEKIQGSCEQLIHYKDIMLCPSEELPGS